MLDSAELQQLLQSTKLSSMSDVINFILEQIPRIINFEPMNDLAYRVSELEKVQGLDCVMLEEVKALIEAMLEQKEDQIKRDLERTVHEVAVEQIHTRRSLREIDIADLMLVNSQNLQQQKLHQNAANSTNNQQIQIDGIRKQILQIRLNIERKCQRRELNDLKIFTQKQLTQKMTLTETEKIIEKFQSDIFHKISQMNLFVQKMEFELKKSVLNEMLLIKKQFMQSSKMSEMKQKIGKIDKKVKKMGVQVNTKLEESKKEFLNQYIEQRQSIEQVCNLIQNLDTKQRQNYEDIQILSSELQKMQARTRPSFESASWVSTSNQLKNTFISWTEEHSNHNPNLYKFEAHKSQIIVTEPGFYRVEGLVFGCQRVPELVMDGVKVSNFEVDEENFENGFSFVNLFLVKNKNCRVGVRIDGDFEGKAVLRIQRIA